MVLRILNGCMTPPCKALFVPVDLRPKACKIWHGHLADENEFHRINWQFYLLRAAMPQRLSNRSADCLWRTAPARFLQTQQQLVHARPA
jgi:hypothetical protein